MWRMDDWTRRGEECPWLGNRNVLGKGTELSKDGIAGALS